MSHQPVPRFKLLSKVQTVINKSKASRLATPNCVLKPKQNITSGVDLYIDASFSLTSVLGTVARPGCRTSTTHCFLHSSLFVRNFLVRRVTMPSLILTAPE